MPAGSAATRHHHPHGPGVTGSGQPRKTGPHRVTREDFAAAVLDKIGAPRSRANMMALLAGMAMEQRPGQGAAYNPLDTTQDWPGSTNFNSVGVKNYPSFQAGVDATARTMEYGSYSKWVSLMKGNAPLSEVLLAMEESPWGWHVGQLEPVVGEGWSDRNASVPGGGGKPGYGTFNPQAYGTTGGGGSTNASTTVTAGTDVFSGLSFWKPWTWLEAIEEWTWINFFRRFVYITTGAGLILVGLVVIGIAEGWLRNPAGVTSNPMAGALKLVASPTKIRRKASRAKQGIKRAYERSPKQEPQYRPPKGSKVKTGKPYRTPGSSSGSEVKALPAGGGTS